MTLTINGVHVLFSAIESLRFQAADGEPDGLLVVRTVSGQEYGKRCPCDKAPKILEMLLERIVLPSSIDGLDVPW